MAFNYSPKIVTDGLVLYLDAANPKSIPVDPTVNLITTNPTPINNLTGYDYAYGAPTASYNATSQSVEITTTNSPVGWLVNNNSLNSTVLSTGSLYTISFEWKPESDSTSLCTIFSQIVTGNNLTSSYSGVMRNSGSSTVTSQNTLLSNGWYLFSQTFTPTHPGVNGDRSFRLLGGGVSGGEKLHIHWRNLQLECTPYRTPFVSGSYQTWFDLSRNNSAATLASSSIAGSIPTFPSASNRVLQFNGTSSYASIPNMPFNPVSNSDFTISVWVKLNAKPLSNPRIVSLGSDANNYFNLGTYGGNSPGTYDTFWFEIKKAGTFYGGFWDSSRKYTTSQWYNLVGTSVNSTNTMAFYINGVSVTGTNVNGGAPSIFNTMFIGTNTTASVEVINGYISQVQMYNRALTAQEVFQNYNATKTRFGLT
jgi:hypothetical protein